METSEGNLPEALDAFAAAEDGYRQAGAQSELPRLHADHALALADANLLDDAEKLIDRAVALPAASGMTSRSPSCCWCRRRSTSPRASPTKPVERGRTPFAASTGRVATAGCTSPSACACVPRPASTPTTQPSPTVSSRTPRPSRRAGWRSEALASVLLAALMHARSRREQQAAALLALAGPQASRGRATDRILLAHVLALLAEQQGRRAGAGGDRGTAGGRRRAGRARLAGDAPHAAQHGAELIEIGARLAVADGRPRELLHRIEAMRTMMWHAPLVRPPDDEAMAARLTDLRRLSAVVADPESPSRGTAGC